MYKLIIALFFFCFIQKISFAQDTLPNISVTQISNKVLVAWNNPFTSLTTINIQRSSDSLKNFSTIGSVLNVRAKTNGFVDAKEFIPAQYYRLFISFEGGTYLFTQSHRPGIDTTKDLSGITETTSEPVQTWFVPSKLVFTGKDNNVIINLPDVDKK
nr:hypothetical protein [Bacteroidota bacterium]